MIQKMNAGIATRLEEVADILEAQQANPYRAQAYRRAAVTVRNCDRPMDEIVREEGVEGLQNLPGIGESLSRTIHQLVTSGRLPILHTTREDGHYTALFSNTAHAHQANKTHDWVVIYYDGGRGERQCTVITAERGPMEGRRIVRGREGECSAYYFMLPAQPHQNGSNSRFEELLSFVR